MRYQKSPANPRRTTHHSGPTFSHNHNLQQSKKTEIGAPLTHLGVLVGERIEFAHKILRGEVGDQNACRYTEEKDEAVQVVVPWFRRNQRPTTSSQLRQQSRFPLDTAVAAVAAVAVTASVIIGGRGDSGCSESSRHQIGAGVVA